MVCVGLAALVLVAASCRGKEAQAPSQGAGAKAGEGAGAKVMSPKQMLGLGGDEASAPEPEAGALPLTLPGFKRALALTPGQHVLFVRRADWAESFDQDLDLEVAQGDEAAQAVVSWDYVPGEVVSRDDVEVEVKTLKADQGERVPQPLVIGLGAGDAPLTPGRAVLTWVPGPRPAMSRALVLEDQGASGVMAKLLDVKMQDGALIGETIKLERAQVLPVLDGLSVGARVYWGAEDVRQGLVVALTPTHAMVRGFSGEMSALTRSLLKVHEAPARAWRAGDLVLVPFLSQYAQAKIKAVDGFFAQVVVGDGELSREQVVWLGELRAR